MALHISTTFHLVRRMYLLILAADAVLATLVQITLAFLALPKIPLTYSYYLHLPFNVTSIGITMIFTILFIYIVTFIFQVLYGC